MTTNPLVQLGALGQSPWLDYITRDLLQSGELSRLIAQDGLRGMTTNPTIFEKAIGGTRQYDGDIRQASASGLDALATYEALAVADVQAACDQFLPLYEATNAADGFVSLEVSPGVAQDPRATVEEARRLWLAVERPNLMIKIPGTSAALPAVRICLGLGVNVNITLLFSVARYAEVLETYVQALEARARAGEPIDRVASVASFFISRIDARIDPKVPAAGAGLRGQVAIANAARAYALFQRTMSEPRWKALERLGARPQRLLWASTSTKDPAYPDVHYVEALIAPETVNTLPPETLAAYRDHGKPAIRILDAVASAEARLAALREAGIDLGEETQALEEEGLTKFAASFSALLGAIEGKATALTHT
jgi:transaldolase